MKKTLTINLNGSIFNIDEDAYQVLNDYLNDLGRHFAQNEKDEILKDIEARIAELFTERSIHRSVINITDVEEVMEILGKPSDFEDEGEATSAEPNKDSSYAKTQRKEHRKLYRDIDNKRIGGVAAGISAYMDWDVTLVRLLFILILLLSVGWTLFIYILMWIFVPEADSIGKRLEMQGVEPTVENIRQHANNVDTSINKKESAPLKVLKICCIIFLGFLGLGLFASVLGILIALIMLFFHLLPFTAGINEVFFLISLSLFLLCPAIAIVLFCNYLLNPNKQRKRWIAWTLFGVWLASIIGLSVTSINSYNHRLEKDSIFNSIKQCNKQSEHFYQKLTDEQRDNTGFESIVVENGIHVIFTQGDSTKVKVNAPEDIISNVTTDVRGGVLYIENEKYSVGNDQKITVYVTAPTLSRIKVSDASSFDGEGKIKFNHLDVEISDASTIYLVGTIDTLKLEVEDASSAHFKKVNSKIAFIKANDASNVEMGKAKELRISSNNDSKVTYMGEPQRLFQQSSNLTISHWEE